MAIATTLTTSVLRAQEPTDKWKADFEVSEGFSVSIDSQGYTLPSAIAFVPNPGNSPDAPLYFVTELEGKVKVVTNDRTVHTFADIPLRLPNAPLRGEAGMGGICLAPEQGYVFATFTNEDEDGSLRNSVLRFETEPNVFSLTPTGQLSISEVFAPYMTAGSHQIGGCQVQGDSLYVSVGDSGMNARAAQDLNLPLGKVLRMNLDGTPHTDNPFYEDDSTRRARNYIWSYGLKNPWGIKATNDRVFVADNGNRIDRFTEVKRGENYLWDSTDPSLAAKADVIITPTGGVAQMDFYPEASTIFPEEFHDSFYLTITRGNNVAGVLMIEYDFVGSQAVSVPRYFMRVGGDQIIAGIAFGPDGLYVAPILPLQDGVGGIIKISYDPPNEHPYRLVETDGNELLVQKGCTGCHVIPSPYHGYGEDFPGIPQVGPSLERDVLVERLRERLNSEEYVRSVEEIDALETEPHVSYRQARQEVLEAEGMDRVRIWIEHRIQEPRFDNRTSLMPKLGITEEEAVLIADVLLVGGSGGGEGVTERAKSLLLPEEVGRIHLVQYFVGGFLIGGIAFAISILVVIGIYRRIRSKN